MKDFNFFSPYLKEQENRRLKILYIRSLCIILSIGLLSFTILNLYQNYKYRAQISMVEDYLSSDKTKNLLNEYERVKRKSELLKTYYDKAAEADLALGKVNTVNTELLNSLSSIMPKDSELINLTVKDRELQLRYSIGSLTTVAELEHNLKGLGILDKIHVSLIDDEGIYTALISCRLKDVI